MKDTKLLRRILGIIIIISGIGNLISGGIIGGILCILCGISLIPDIYENEKIKNIKALPIVLPIILFMLFSIATSIQNVKNNASNIVNMNISEEETKDIEKLTFFETNMEIDIKETKDIYLSIYPSKADVTQLVFNSTNNQVINFSKNSQKSNGTNIYGKLQPIAEGECEVYVNSNEITSNKVKIKVIDKERIEKEEQAKKEAEEASKRAAEQEQAAKQTQAQPQRPTTTQSTVTTDNSQTVYRTPTGKRYHYSPTCGGKNSIPTTLSDAISRGLTPCQKCAQ